jgi:hypothetical protein
MSDEKPEMPQAVFFNIEDLKPSPQNDLIYRPSDPSDKEIRALAVSVARHGILEPLVVTLDSHILSGHRRHAAAKLARLKQVPCRVENIYSYDDGFLERLREYNRQRPKSLDEKWREEIVSADPEESYRSLVQHRHEQSRVSAEFIEIEDYKRRAGISKVKAPFLAAIRKVIRELQEFWPVSIRQIHYQLLNNPPLVHASKPHSTYQNNIESYDALLKLAVRARIFGLIPWDVIADETRPVILGDNHSDTAPFIRRELDWFLKQYRRNLQQSQPCHIEVIGEKNTVLGVLRPITDEYCLPLTIIRGQSSSPPRYEIAQRFKASGKDRLILLIASDFDPDGEAICNAFARSLRDDFHVPATDAIKVALTAEQVMRFNLPPDLVAKPKSVNYKKFVSKYGTAVSELEALPPRVLQSELRAAIDSVLDHDAFNAEIEEEKQDSAGLENIRRQVHKFALTVAGPSP